jgi:amino acid adenylation domain-containing protein
MSTAPKSPLGLSAQKKALLAKMLQKEGANAKNPPQISRRPPEVDSPPLTYAQERLLFLDRLMPDTPAYNIAVNMRLRGSLDAVTLEAGLGVLIERHEILRTTFADAGDHAVQHIAPSASVPFRRVDLRDLDTTQRPEHVDQLARQEAETPFDLSQGPLLRTTLLQLGDQDHVLLVTMHHIISDAESFAAFFRQWSALYSTPANGTPTPDAKPATAYTTDYGDYAYWQRAAPQRQTHERELAYWRAQLAGPLPLLQLPLDRPRPALQSYSGALRSAPIPQELTQQLKTLARKESSTFFMLMLAAFKVMLHRYSHQDDIVVGTTLTNRNHVETAHMIGLFQNTLVLRTDLSGHPSFRHLLRQVRQVALDAYDHQTVPFERLIEALQPERNLSYNPLFQAAFVYQNTPERALWTNALQLDGVEAESLTTHSATAKFDFTLSIEDLEDRTLASIEYNTALFDGATIDRALDHLGILLEAVAADPDTSIDRLPILAKAERRQVLSTWNDTRAEYPRHACLHQLFEDQAKKSPDRIAVLFEGETWTYRRLDQRANRIASALNARGAGPGTLVGLCTERSLDMVAALLGILKAGAAYVPMDPSYPSERLAFMVEDADMPVVLTQEALAPDLPIRPDQILCLETLPADTPTANNPSATPHDLAYVIFTSGSTGRPKGVQIQHCAVVNFLHAMRHRPGIGPDDALLAVTTLSFDIAVLEIFLPLLNGARLVLADRRTAADGRLLADTLDQADITLMQATPATWRLLLEAGWQGRPQLNILCGGESLPADLAQGLRTKGKTLWNLYGPTETTIWSTLEQIHPPPPSVKPDSRDLENQALKGQVPNEQAPIPIGRPLANTQIYILDPQSQPVPIGVPGELFIGGDGLALGYLGRPELTQEKFVANPFSAITGTRLYRTGDLARYRSDGRIECIGRIDNQVKMRGFRIELGEIEATLGRHPEVGACAAIVREDRPGDQRLVAYWVAAGAAPQTAALRHHLLESLPDYMVPSALVELERLPLTPNGKIDRQALPAPAQDRPVPGQTPTAPRDQREQSLATIWAEVLGVDQVGIDDHFFESGGHSLLAMTLLTRIEAELEIKIPLKAIFQGPTVRQLSAFIGQRDHHAPWSSLIPLQPNGSRPPVFFVHGLGGGMLWGYTELANQLGQDQPAYAFGSRGRDGMEEFDSIEEMAAQYVKDMRTLQPEGPYCLGGYCFAGNVAYEMAQQLYAQGQTVDLLALFEAYPLSVEPDSLWRPLAFCRFLRNLYYRSKDIARLPTKGRWHFLMHKPAEIGRSLGKKLLRRFKGQDRDIPLDELVPYQDDRYSAVVLKLWETHFTLLKKYKDRPYPGRVTLFRTRTESLLYSFGPALGWQSMALGGVDIETVTGPYHALFYQPHVEDLAAKFRTRLDRIHATSTATAPADLDDNIRTLKKNV